MNFQSFSFELENNIAFFRLDRADRINALTFEVYRELTEAFATVAELPDARAVVLSGAGPRGFCSGGDVRDIIGELFERDAAGLLEFTRQTGALIAAIRQCPLPVVAALHGVVAGAGAVVALAADLRIAADTTRIAFLFPEVGLCGADMGAAYLLPRVVGLGIASELLLTGSFVSAERAERIGLLNRVVAEGTQLEVATEVATHLARGPRFAHGMTKRMLEAEAHMDFRSAIEAEAQAQALCMQHPDFREGFEGRMAKRQPSFR